MGTGHRSDQISNGHPPVEMAAQLKRDEPALRSSLDFGPFVHQGQGTGPALIIGDQAEIPLLHGVFQSRRDYRMALLSQPSDVVIVRHRDEVFEHYLDEILGIGDVTYLQASNIFNDPVTVEALSWGELGDTLDTIAFMGTSFTLKPYLTTQNTWRLAKHLGEISQQEMHVCGPSPRISKRANDKLWFSDLTRQLLGRDATPPTMPAYGLAGAAAEIAFLARSCDHIVAKIPDSAGSAGNITFRSADLAGMSQKTLQHLLRIRLEATGWTDRYPILIGVWERSVISSPSVQLWIPDSASGPPHAEGVFEQHTRTAEAAFVGASKSSLPGALQKTLSAEAVLIATVLQALGYFGRCSLDSVICRTPAKPDKIHWIECNGRWGGVSIPMTVAKTLKGGRIPNGFLVMQEYRPDLQEIETQQFLARLDDLLYRKGICEEGIVVLSPPTSPLGVSVNLLAVGSNPRIVELLMNEALGRLPTKSVGIV